MDKKGCIKIIRRKTFVLHCRTLLQRKLSVLCFRKFPVAKKFMDKRGGYQEFPTENFLCDNADNFRKGTLCVVFQKTSVSEKDYG